MSRWGRIIFLEAQVQNLKKENFRLRREIEDFEIALNLFKKRFREIAEIKKGGE